jgi:hypothetical protein
VSFFLAVITALTISVHGGDAGDRVYTLACDPARGTVRNPAAACATLGQHPELLKTVQGDGHSCPPLPAFQIDGTFDDAAVSASFSSCVYGQEEGAGQWSRLVHYGAPTLHGRPSLKVDRGLGPLRLGAKSSAVEHGKYGAVLPNTRVQYTLLNHGQLIATYGANGRIARIESHATATVPALAGWRHFTCRPARVYVHHTGKRWTAVAVNRTGHRRAFERIVATGAVPRTCAALNFAS